MKTVINFRVDKELKNFLHRYAKANHSTISRILTDYIVRLKKNHAKNLEVSDIPNERTEKNA